MFVCLSVCRLSGCNVRAPYSGDWNFGNLSTPFNTLVIWQHPGKILQRSSQVFPLQLYNNRHPKVWDFLGVNSRAWLLGTLPPSRADGGGEICHTCFNARPRAWATVGTSSNVTPDRKRRTCAPRAHAPSTPTVKHSGCYLVQRNNHITGVIMGYHVCPR